MDVNGPTSYKQFAGLGQAQLGSAAIAPSRPQRPDGVTARNDANFESLSGLVDKLRSVRARMIGEVPEAGNKDGVRALRSGHVGRLEDQAEALGCVLLQAHEILSDIESL